jgi:5-methylthioribose kinase
MGYYDKFGNYYRRTEALVYKPGYFSLHTNYFIETNLYELKSGALVWSGRSYAFEPQDLEKTMSSYAKRLFKELLKNGVIAI